MFSWLLLVPRSLVDHVSILLSIHTSYHVCKAIIKRTTRKTKHNSTDLSWVFGRIAKCHWRLWPRMSPAPHPAEQRGRSTRGLNMVGRCTQSTWYVFSWTFKRYLRAPLVDMRPIQNSMYTKFFFDMFEVLCILHNWTSWLLNRHMNASGDA